MGFLLILSHYFSNEGKMLRVNGNHHNQHPRNFPQLHFANSYGGSEGMTCMAKSENK